MAMVPAVYESMVKLNVSAPIDTPGAVSNEASRGAAQHSFADATDLPGSVITALTTNGAVLL